MGRNTAIDLAMSDISLEGAISMHLQYNHYPPVPQEMVAVCIEAIDAYWEDDGSRLIQLPEKTFWRGQDKAPAYAIIDGHHLHPWCESDEYE